MSIGETGVFYTKRRSYEENLFKARTFFARSSDIDYTMVESPKDSSVPMKKIEDWEEMDINIETFEEVAEELKVSNMIPVEFETYMY